ncbi:mannose-6-phosphate receptor binding protein 1 [Clinocottus analis]|uniref:mannose-6-phosphate receptor binding protein 1 n=1 Tax=Clinocottus analis TaxID=304258 RepID=UPI0035BEFDDD
MADSGKTNETGAAAAEPANEDQQNVVSRVCHLPLVSSACKVVSSAYCSTKDSVPLLKGVMDVAESGVRTLGAAATTGSKPILDIIEPQLATVNEYALKGLNKMEEKLPILHQPADKVVLDTVGMMYQSVAGAKGAVMGAVKGGVEMTRAAVGGGITTMGTRMGQMVSSGIGMALSRSEDWVDQNLPLTEKELAAVAEPASSEAAVPSSPSYFVRLGKLSSKVQERALQQSLVRARHARDATFSTVAQISSTLDLLERARTGLGTASNQIGEASEQLLQRWTEWKQKQAGVEHTQTQTEPDETRDEAEQLEWRVLSMVHGLSDQLRSTCTNVVSSAQGLPGAVQDQLTSARRSAEELHSSLGTTSTITPLLLEQSRHHLNQVRQSLDGVMEYLLHNTPLNWLVGPFAPQIIEKDDVAMDQSGPHN